MQASSSLPHRSATNQIIAQHGGHGWYKPPGDTTEMPAHELVDTVGSYYGTPFDGPAHCIDRLGDTMRDGIKKPNRSSSLPDENLVAEGNGVILPDGIEYSKGADSAVTENKNQTTAVTNVACATLALATPYSIGKRGIVPKRRFQTGTFVKRGENWVGMWRVDVIQPDGTLKREQHSKTFVGLSERAARAGISTNP